MTCLECTRPMRANSSSTGSELRHAGRGLCWRCYNRAERAGTLADYECLRRSPDEVLEEWELLRSAGHTRAQAAELIGMKPDSLYRALARGDQRATA